MAPIRKKIFVILQERCEKGANEASKNIQEIGAKYRRILILFSEEMLSSTSIKQMEATP